MIWLTWRQFRGQAIVAMAALAALAIALAITGPQLAHLFAASGIAACGPAGDCGTLTSKFISDLQADGAYKALYFLGIGVLYAAPVLIGVFWGAPLVTREFEAGTFRLAWNQSVTRIRWLWAKLGLVGLAAMATAGLFSLIVSWWASPIDRAIQTGRSGGGIGFGRLDPLVFGARDIVPIGYAAFAFALGVTAGVLIRRTVPAMVATLTSFAAVETVWTFLIRAHLITPLRAIAPLGNPANLGLLIIQNGNSMTVQGNWTMPGAWVLSNQSIDRAGHVFTGPPTQACLGNSTSACNAWLASKHLRQLVTYQPASRFWAFQWSETAIFLALALALAGFCAWWISRRRSS
jgi:hypothetical protein